MYTSKNNHSYLFTTLLLLNFIAIGIAVYLCLSHYWNYTDMSYASFCAITQAINCDTVAQSSWSILWGIPVAHYGLFGYLLFLILLLSSRHSEYSSRPSSHSLWALLVLLGGLYSLTSIYFSYVSATKIHSYCILCLICFAVNLFLFYISLLVYRRQNHSTFGQEIVASFYNISRNKLLLTSIICLTLLFSVGGSFLPQYWLFTKPFVKIDLKTGTTPSGNPWIGAKNPQITITEYSDYLCFQCRKTHFILRNIVAQYPEELRLIHRHYPLDHEFNPTVVANPFHIGSGKMALLAIYAMTKDKFWEMNDALFSLGKEKESFNIESLSKKVDLPFNELGAAISNPYYRKILNHDILSGMKLRIIATPTFIIDGEKYTGSIPPEALNTILMTAKQGHATK
jgi:protein-disulfide isomerase/uncharacterized membrane protein